MPRRENDVMTWAIVRPPSRAYWSLQAEAILDCFCRVLDQFYGNSSSFPYYFAWEKKTSHSRGIDWDVHNESGVVSISFQYGKPKIHWQRHRWDCFYSLHTRRHPFFIEIDPRRIRYTQWKKCLFTLFIATDQFSWWSLIEEMS